MKKLLSSCFLLLFFLPAFSQGKQVYSFGKEEFLLDGKPFQFISGEMHPARIYKEYNLGRYWNIGPQQRLYCPGTLLKKDNNKIIVFDLHQLKAATISGNTTLE